MTTDQTIDGVQRDDLELVLIHGHSTTESNAAWDRLRALLEAESAPCAKSQVEGKRERFQKWVMATKHPVYGFLDGRSLARGDDRTGYADEYVQGLWVAYLEFGAEQPAPVAVVPEGFMLVERGIWTEDQVESAAKCITMLKGVPGMTDRDLAMAAMDAGQCKAPEIVPEPVAAVRMCDCNQGRMECNGKCKP